MSVSTEIATPVAAPASESRTEAASWRKWLSLALLHLMTAAIGTTSTAKGVFFPALVAEFNLSHAAGAALISVSAIVSVIVAIPLALAIGRFVSAKTAIVAMTLLASLGFFIASTAQSYNQLLGAYLLMSGQAVNMVAIGFLLTNWFTRWRGIALAVVFSGTMTGGVLLTPILTDIVQNAGWRAGYAFIAAPLSVIALLLALVLVNDNARGRQVDKSAAGLSFRGALLTRSYWLIVFAYLAFIANTSVYFVHFFSMLTEHGLAQANVALVMSQLFLLAGFAKLVFGYTGDRLQPGPAMALALALSAAAWVVFAQFGAHGAALPPFIILFGLSYSGPLVLGPVLIARVFGRRSFTLIDTSVTVIASALGNALAPILAGRVFDVTGSYGPMYGVLAAWLALGAAAVLFVRRDEQNRVSATRDASAGA